MRRMVIAAGIWLCGLHGAQALDLGVGVNASLGMRGAESYVAIGYGSAAIGYTEPGIDLSGTAPGWYLSFGSWLSPYLGLDARLGATEVAGLGRALGLDVSARLSSWYGLYLRPQWTGDMLAVHALAGFAQFQYERTLSSPGTTLIEAVNRTGFSFGAGAAFAPSPGFQLGLEWLAIARGASLGAGISGSASLLSAYALFSF